jgi:hypothetical protein
MTRDDFRKVREILERRRRDALKSLLQFILFSLIDFGITIPMFYFININSIWMFMAFGFMNGVFAYRLASIVIDSVEERFYRS